jgi:hypothetical protein
VKSKENKHMLGASFGKKLSFENPRVVGYLPSKVVEV